MGAGVDVFADHVEATGERDLDVALERPAEERFRGGPARVVGDDDLARFARASPRLPLRLAEDDCGSGRDDRELLRGDRLPRVAEHIGVIERDVRQHDDTGAEDVGRVMPPAEARLDDGDVDPVRGELGERGRGQHLELRRRQPLRRPTHA